jgi:hypothetical protein
MGRTLDDVSPLAELIIAILLPTAAGYAIIIAFRSGRQLNRARRRPAPAEPIEQLATTLRRLRSQLEETEARPGTTAKSHRVKAVRGAYLDVLVQACGRLDVTPPQGGDWAGQADIYRAEAELRSRGLDVRQTAVR